MHMIIVEFTELYEMDVLLGIFASATHIRFGKGSFLPMGLKGTSSTVHLTPHTKKPQNMNKWMRINPHVCTALNCSVFCTVLYILKADICIYKPQHI